MKKLLLLATLLLAAPAKAEAITWGEFWEPFKPDEVHYHYERPIRRERVIIEHHYHEHHRHRHLHYHPHTGIMHSHGHRIHGHGHNDNHYHH